jgi:hypothetical protein
MLVLEFHPDHDEIVVAGVLEGVGGGEVDPHRAGMSKGGSIALCRASPRRSRPDG